MRVHLSLALNALEVAGNRPGAAKARVIPRFFT
jgi:hypothetical protein